MKIQSKMPHSFLLSQLAALMREQGINVSELARRAGVPQPTLYRLLNSPDNDPRLSTLTAVARYFDVPLDYFQREQPPAGKTSIVPIYAIDELHHADRIPLANLIASCPSEHCYGVQSTQAMQPKIAADSVVLIQPTTVAKDGQIVLVHYQQTNKIAIREFHDDGPDCFYRTLNTGRLTPQTHDNIIIGVAFQVTTEL